MLDTGFYEAMKARPIPCPGSASSTVATVQGSPGQQGGSPLSSSYDSENNLNKPGDRDMKGGYDKHVINIDKENYMLKPGPTPHDHRMGPRGMGGGLPTTTTVQDSILFNVTSPSECRTSALTCLCRPSTGGSSSSPSSGGHYIYSSGSGSSSSSCSSSGSSGHATFSHVVSSLLPLVECRACFHKICSPHAATHPCTRPHDTLPPATHPRDVPISQWSSSNVVDWMATLNLAPYTELFKAKDIKGADLLTLDRDKLGSMGIKDEFHQKAILVCIDQLQNGGHDGDPGGPGVGDCSTPASHHTLRNHSFHDLRRCDKCGLYLRGFIHQGQFCQDCGLIAHRTCAATGLPPCVQHSSSYFSRIMLSSVFGLSLCTQFNPGESMAPLLLVRCCEELLYQAKSDSSLDLYRLYRTPPQQDSLAKLREACDDDINAADLGLYEPHVIAYLIKRYLRELPEPVIPENCYDRFIGAAQIDNDEQCARSITQLVKELNPHHYYTLKFLMTHFLQLCQLQVSRGNKDPPTLLIQSLCHVFLRPPWDKIVELARNTDYHMRIVEMLLLKVDWGEKVPSFPSAPALPPRIRPRQSVQSYSSSGYDPVDPIMSPSSPPMGMPIMPIAGPLPVTNIPSDAPKALQESEWYWGNITRDDVNVLMRDAKDGTFLVRDASTGNNEYTLTVRKGGSNKLIKICHRNGMYGFIEPLNFNSVVDLINYCQQQNLSQFNKALDIKLLYPVSRNTYGDESESRGLRVEEILSILADYNKQYKEKTIQWNICYEKQQLASQEIQNYRQALESFNEMIAWLQDHLDLHDKLKLEAQPHEINELSVNRNVLQERIDQVRDAQGKYTLHLNNTMSDCRSADRTCNSLKMECSQLMKMRDQLKNVLLSRGISADMIDKWLEQADPHQPQPIQPLAELHNESLWLHENCTREEAQNILRGRPDGTFLIRMAQNGGYALSIACNKEVQHCRIYQGENGFGFAEPFLIYATLRDLVLHYSKNSLLMHNDLLNTTLNFPARPGS